MKETIYKITEGDKFFLLEARWDYELNSFIKYYRGRWESKSKGWRVPVEFLNEIKEKLYTLYGSADGLNVELVIKKYIIRNSLRLFSRDLIKIDYFNNFYTTHFSMQYKESELPIHWTLVDDFDLTKNEFKCYVVKKIAIFLNPFVIKNLTIRISNVSSSDVEFLKSKNLPWILDINVLN